MSSGMWGDARPVPYAADVRAKGWRLELDYERIEQSDTWDLAAEVPMARPALLMMWFMAWKQLPCGSFPADEDVIRAKCGIPSSQWGALRSVMLRGWWLAEDGRLYHDTIVERVREMLGYRQKEADRRNRNRRKGDDGEAPGDGVGGGGGPPGGDDGSGSFPPLSRGTIGGTGKDSDGTPDTGTGTGTSLSPPFVAKAQKSSTHKGARLSKNAEQPEGGEVLTAADAFGAQLLQLRLSEVGIDGVSPTDSRLVGLSRAGVLPDELEAAAKAALKARAEHPLPWAIARVEAQRRDAQARQIEAAAGPTLDPDSREAIEADGVRFGVGRWLNFDPATGKTTPWPVYKAKVVGLRSRAEGGGGALS